MTTYTIKIDDLEFGFRSSNYSSKSPYLIYRKGWSSFFYTFEIEKYFNVAGYEPVSNPEVEELLKYGEAYMKAVDKFNRLLVFA